MGQSIQVIFFGALGILASHFIQGHFTLSGGNDLIDNRCAIAPGEGIPSTGIKGLDWFSCFMATFFSSALQRPVITIELLNALTGPVAIIILESMRQRGERGIQRPIWIGIAFQLLGAGIVVPLYWLFYVKGDVEGMRLKTGIDCVLTRSVLFGLTFGYILPTAALLYFQTPKVILSWQLFPIWVGVIQYLYIRFSRASRPYVVEPQSSNTSGRILPTAARLRDQSTVQTVLLVLIVLLSAIHIATIGYILSGPDVVHTLYETFIPSVRVPTKEATTILSASLHFLKWDLVFITLSSCLAMIWTLDVDGVSQWDVAWKLTAAVIVVGPGAAILGLWRIRESCWNQAELREERNAQAQ